MYTVDEELVMTLRSYLWTLMSVISTIVVITSVNPLFAFCLIPIVAFYVMQQRFFTVRFVAQGFVDRNRIEADAALLTYC